MKTDGKDLEWFDAVEEVQRWFKEKFPSIARVLDVVKVSIGDHVRTERKWKNRRGGKDSFWEPYKARVEFTAGFFVAHIRLDRGCFIRMDRDLGDRQSGMVSAILRALCDCAAHVLSDEANGKPEKYAQARKISHVEKLLEAWKKRDPEDGFVRMGNGLVLSEDSFRRLRPIDGKLGRVAGRVVETHGERRKSTFFMAAPKKPEFHPVEYEDPWDIPDAEEKPKPRRQVKTPVDRGMRVGWHDIWVALVREVVGEVRPDVEIMDRVLTPVTRDEPYQTDWNDLHIFRAPPVEKKVSARKKLSSWEIDTGEVGEAFIPRNRRSKLRPTFTLKEPRKKEIVVRTGDAVSSYSSEKFRQELREISESFFGKDEAKPPPAPKMKASRPTPVRRGDTVYA